MDADDLMMLALDAGAEDFSEEEDSFEILTAPDDFSAVRETLEKEGVPMAEAEVTHDPAELCDPDRREPLLRTFREHWIFWMRTTTYRTYSTTGMSKEPDTKGERL